MQLGNSFSSAHQCADEYFNVFQLYIQNTRASSINDLEIFFCHFLIRKYHLSVINDLRINRIFIQFKENHNNNNDSSNVIWYDTAFLLELFELRNSILI